MLNINNKYIDLCNECEVELKDRFKEIDDLCFFNSKKVLMAFHEYNVSSSDFNVSSGYGFGDYGRDKIEKIFAYIFDSEDALVRSQIISGTHAISTGLFGILRPGDVMMSISGKPYDTLHEVIGIKDNNSSLKSFNIEYKEIDLINNDFDYDKISKSLDNIRMVYIQRSRGYSLRESIDIEKIEKVINLVKSINKDIIVFVDNCYCEFTESKFPTSIGADIMAGSLIKNLGGGIASNGGYLAGRSDLINLCAERLNVAGEGREIGPTSSNKMFLMGLYHAPYAVASSLKSAYLSSLIFEKLGYKVSPKSNENRCDIVNSIYFHNEEEMISFVKGIQAGGAINAHVTPTPSDMPGYSNQIIMASPSFTDGSSIEISCDAPLREPYVLFLQGGLTYDYAKIAILNGISNLK